MVHFAKICLRFLLLVFLLNKPLTSFCQKPSDTATKVTTIGNSAIKDCLVAYKYIWILREDGCIIRINSESMDIADSLKFDKKIVAIGISHKGSIYAADENGLVFGINYYKDTNLVWHTNQAIQSI